MVASQMLCMSTMISCCRTCFCERGPVLVSSSTFRPASLVTDRLSTEVTTPLSGQCLALLHGMVSETVNYPKAKRGFYNLTNGFYLSSQFLSLPPPLFVADIVDLHYSLAMPALLSHRERALFSDFMLKKTPASRRLSAADVVGTEESFISRYSKNFRWH